MATSVPTIHSNAISIPPPPPFKSKQYFIIHTQRKRRTTNEQISDHLRTKYNLSSIKYSDLPDEHCIFYWIQLVRHKDIQSILSKSLMNKPCIAYVPNQGILTEKTRFAQTMYAYYGEDAWNYTPKTFYVRYNANNQKWEMSADSLKELFKDSNAVWITKTNIGSLGKNIFLFSGNSLESLHAFLKKNYDERMKKESNRFRFLADYEKYIDPNGAQSVLKSVIIQKYLNKPLLFDGFYKFDIRIYALLASTNPCVLFYKFAKVRICASKFENLSSNVVVTDDDDEKYVNITDKQELAKRLFNVP